MHAAQGLGIHISYRTDDDVGSGFRSHGATLRAGHLRVKSDAVAPVMRYARPPDPSATALLSERDNEMEDPSSDRYARPS